MDIHWCSLDSLHSLHRHCLLISLVRLDSWNCRLNNCSCWLGNCCSCNCSAFNSLASSHFLLNSMFNSFFLSWILDFFFNSLLWNVVSLSLIANFWNIFYLMINNLVFSDVFIYWNSNSLFKLVIFSNYLFIRNIFKSAFSSHNLTKLRSNSCSLKQNSLSYWFNIRLSTHHSSFNNNWLALYWWRTASTSDYLTSHSSSHCWKLNLLWSIRSGICWLCNCCAYHLSSLNRTGHHNWLLYGINSVDHMSWRAYCALDLLLTKHRLGIKNSWLCHLRCGIFNWGCWNTLVNYSLLSSKR